VKTNHTKATLKSILYGEGIRLRRINQKKDYPTRIKWSKEYTSAQTFLSTWETEMASNWVDRLLPRMWHTILFPPFANTTTKENRLNAKAKITYKRPTTSRQKLTNYQQHGFNKTRKELKCASEPCKHCSLCGCHLKTQQIHGSSFDKHWQK